jgi:hypothetical protein
MKIEMELKINIEKFLVAPRLSNLIAYTDKIFGEKVSDRLINDYCLGCLSSTGATILWRLDVGFNPINGEVTSFDPCNGNIISSMPVIDILKDRDLYEVGSMWFGGHLICHSENIAVVPSEISAILGSARCPSMTWLAVGGHQDLNKDLVNMLSGKGVIFYPDNLCFEYWQTVISDCKGRFIVSDKFINKDINKYLIG